MLRRMTIPTGARRALSILALAAGTALLLWQVRETGAGEIARGFYAVGAWGSLAILVLSLLRFAARSTGWSALIEVETPPGRTLAAVIAGDAAGNLTPLSWLVSEPAKAAMLVWAVPGLATSRALAALAAETFFFGVSVAIYSMFGAIALLYVYDIDKSLQVAGLVTLAAMAVCVVIAVWMSLRKPTVVGSALSRLPFGPIRRLGEKVRAFERTAYASTTHPAARVGVVVAAAAFFHLLSLAEMWLTLWLITGESLLIPAFVLDTVGRLTNVVFKMIPLQLGVLQVGSELVARATGLAPGVGVTISLVRTARVILWAGVGLLILARYSTNNQQPTTNN